MDIGDVSEFLQVVYVYTKALRYLLRFCSSSEFNFYYPFGKGVSTMILLGRASGDGRLTVFFARRPIDN